MTHDLPMICPFKLAMVIVHPPRGVQVVHQHLGAARCPGDPGDGLQPMLLP